MAILSSANDKYFTEFILSLKYLANKVKLSKDIEFQLPSKESSLVYNTEQLTRKWWAEKVAEVSRSYHLFDYATANAEIVQQIHPDASITIVPILFDPEQMLFPQPLEKTYDVVFVGCLTPRRKTILDQLQRRNVRLSVLENVYDVQEKYNNIARAHILLNIHADIDYTVFEFARCSIPVFNGQFVVSEESKKDSNEMNTYVMDHCVFAPFEDLVETVVNLLPELHRNGFTRTINYQKLQEINEREFKRLQEENCAQQ